MLLIYFFRMLLFVMEPTGISSPTFLLRLMVAHCFVNTIFILYFVKSTPLSSFSSFYLLLYCYNNNHYFDDDDDACYRTHIKLSHVIAVISFFFGNNCLCNVFQPQKVTTAPARQASAKTEAVPKVPETVVKTAKVC